VAKHQPHPPGYILYVLPLGKAPVRYAGYTLRPAR
jgi:hypothetical protein